MSEAPPQAGTAPRSIFTLARLLTGAVLLLGLMLAAALGFRSLDSWRLARDVGREAEEVLAASRFGTGLAIYLNERQVALNVLGRDAPATPAERAAIDRTRAEAQSRLAA
ncbi:MAG: hypothetical protein K2X11_11395, partial [Acetobacteraceae bacterium]|nr:hypothetical protein [Acetobacteraceae bacterium]